MDLREIGTILREERERQGLTLDAVSDKIKITRSCLAAIEDGNERALPHPVYAKGFIKNYAKLLGVDQAEFDQSLTEIYQLEEPALHDLSVIHDVVDDSGDGSSRIARFPVAPLTLGLVGVVLVAGLGWYLFTHVFSRSSGEEERTPSQVATEPATPNVPPKPATADSGAVVPTVAPQKMEDPAPTPKTVTPEPKVEARPEAKVASELPRPTSGEAPRQEPTPEDRATQDIATSGPTAVVPTVPVAPESAAPMAPSAKTLTVGDTGSHTVAIVAKERCWLQAGADGGSMHEAMLEKGDGFVGRFADYMLVRLGNAGAVEIRFDNKLYPLQAGKGSVKTLKFVAKKAEEEAAKAASQAPTQAQVQPQTGTPVAPTTTAMSAAPTAAPATAAGDNTSTAREVEIYGQDGSWIMINPDKGPAKEIYVKKGQRISVPFDEKVEIKLGNPSRVIFRYDGKETPVTTEKGGSRTIRFP